MNSAAFIAALAMGLTGSLHCAGMCGPIIWVLPFSSFPSYKRWIAIGLYHTGRISMYAALGWLLYAFRALFHPQWQQYVSIAAGVVLLLAGLWSFFPGRLPAMRLPWMGLVQARLGKLLTRPSLHGLFLGGVLNGLLPCGLVYMALSLSVTAGSASAAILLMYTFGAGTLPMLVGITLLRRKLRFTSGVWIRRWVPLALFFFGSLLVVRGMNLGIPYLSPRISMEQHTLKASCCHKPQP